MKYIEILYKTYELKIAGRENHVVNFHKWMTFYSVAIGAILVAFSQKHADAFYSNLFIAFGLITSFLFHLSCKGYKHWNDHWISEIWDFEVEIEKEIHSTLPISSDKTQDKFKIFGRQAKNQEICYHPLKSAKISTPKVTLAFSFCVFLGWLLLLAKQILTSIIGIIDKNHIIIPNKYAIAIGITVVVSIFIWLILYWFSRYLYSESRLKTETEVR